MKIPTLIFGSILAISVAFAGGVIAGEKKQRETESTTLMKKESDAEQLQVTNKEEFQRALDLARRNNDGAVALEISCHPPDHEWCAGGFQAACDDHEGGLSTNPDGGITCSMPD